MHLIYGTHALVSEDFVRIGGKAIEGALVPTGPVVVGGELPSSNPIKAVSVHRAGLDLPKSMADKAVSSL